jgi:amino acid transporter
MAIRPADTGLKREIGLIGATWASETSIIGSGWLLASFTAASLIGSAAIIDWLLGGVAVIILGLIHAELGGMYPVAGGTARFPHLAFGGAAGISFGFFSWLQAVTVAPIECYAVMRYLEYYWHWVFNPATGDVTHDGFGLTIALMALFTVVNLFGIKWFNRILSVITWWKVIIPVATIIILFTKFHSANFSAGGGFFPTGVGWKDVFGALPGAGIVFAYLGFEQADQLAAEVKNPQRNLPLAIIIAVLIGVVVYCLLQVVFIGATPASLLTHGFAGIPSTNQIAIAPFAGLSAAVGLGVWATFLRVDGFISPSGTGLAYFASTSRVGYGLARNKYYPSIFQATDRNGVPWFSVLMAFVFGLVFLLPFPSWQSLVGLVTSASVLMYAGAPLSMGVFRRVLPHAERPYKLPGAVVLGPVGFIIASLIIYWSGFETIWKLGVAIILGYLFILMYQADKPDAPKMRWAKSWWILVYELGIGIISWQGAYGPDNTNRLQYPWDILTVSLFSLAVYIAAVYFLASSREEIEELMAEQSAPTEETTEEAAAA